jgi:hypothetical protein
LAAPAAGATHNRNPMKLLLFFALIGISLASPLYHYINELAERRQAPLFAAHKRSLDADLASPETAVQPVEIRQFTQVCDTIFCNVYNQY